MRSTGAQALLSVGAFILIGSVIAAAMPRSETDSPMANRARVTSADTSVTGCLQKGSMNDQFILQDKGGKRYRVMSNTVALAEHVGHTVTLTGTPTSESAGDVSDKSTQPTRDKDSTGMSGTNDSTRMQGMGMHAPNLQVAKLAMVSSTCK